METQVRPRKFVENLDNYKEYQDLQLERTHEKRPLIPQTRKPSRRSQSGGARASKTGTVGDALKHINIRESVS